MHLPYFQLLVRSPVALQGTVPLAVWATLYCLVVWAREGKPQDPAAASEEAIGAAAAGERLKATC